MSHGVQGEAGTAREVAATMQALSTRSRLRILGRLRSVGDLAQNALEQLTERGDRALYEAKRIRPARPTGRSVSVLGARYW